MVLGLSSDPQSSRFETGEEDSYEFAKAGRVKHGDPFRRAFGRVVGVNPSAGNRALPSGAHLVDPK